MPDNLNNEQPSQQPQMRKHKGYKSRVEVKPDNALQAKAVQYLHDTFGKPKDRTLNENSVIHITKSKKGKAPADDYYHQGVLFIEEFKKAMLSSGGSTYKFNHWVVETLVAELTKEDRV